MDDEQQSRDLIARWLRLSAEGDIAQILPLMTEDVVFLVTGQPPMRGRDAFAASFAGWQDKFRLETNCEIQEVQVGGNLAYSWTQLTVTMTPIAEGLQIDAVGTRSLSYARTRMAPGKSFATRICLSQKWHRLQSVPASPHTDLKSMHSF